MKTVTCLLVMAVSLGAAQAGRAQPRIVIGLRHSANQKDDPFQPSDGLNVKRFDAPDVRSAPAARFAWHMQTGPMSETGYKSLPPGVVLGLKHSLSRNHRSIQVAGKDPIGDRPPPGMGRGFGRDMGAGRTVGLYWFESVGSDFPWKSLPAKISSLPRGAMFALTHTENARKTPLRWRIEGKAITLDPTRTDPTTEALLSKLGIEPKHGGDLGPSKSGQGFHWFEKVK